MQDTFNQQTVTEYAARVLLGTGGRGSSASGKEGARYPASAYSKIGIAHTNDVQLERVFASLTLSRELETRRRDALGRFDEQAIRWNISKPWIDLWAQRTRYKGGETEGRRNPLPPRFQVIIAHDVDRTSAWEPTAVAKALSKASGLRSGLSLGLKTTLSPGSLVRNVERILKFESSHGIGAHYFMMAGPYRPGRYSARTDIRWPSARTVARLIQQAGMPIGLHGSFSAKDRDSYAREKDRLEQVLGREVTTHRNHYLRFDPVKLYAQLEQAGILFDLSVGFVTRIGFRAGCARCHRAFDLLNGRPSKVFSVPQLYMDTVMRHHGPSVIVSELRSALSYVKDAGGCVCLVFHPELFLMDSRAWPLFERIIQLCRELGANLSGRLPRMT